MNLMEICRLCLIKSSKNSEEIFLDTTFIHDKFEEITQTKLTIESQNFQYPKKVCISCVTELEQHFNYRSSLIENQKRLQTLLGVNEDEVETLENDEEIEFKFVDEIKQDQEEEQQAMEEEEEEEEELEEVYENEDSMHEIVEEVYPEEFEEQNEEIVIEQSNEEDEEFEFVQFEEDSVQINRNPRKRKQYSKKNQIYSCWIEGCNQKVGFRSSMKRHMIQAHQITITKSTCLLCGNFYEKYSDYLAHVKIHTRNSTCDICMMTFVDDEKLSKHKDRVHNSKEDGLRIHECSICKARFKRHEHVVSHMAYKHSDSTARKFSCSHPQCNSAFFRRSDLKTHEKGHEGVMMKCIYCDYCRRDLKSLKRHTLSVHNSTKLYKCQCDEEFDSHRELQHHRKQCSGSIPIDRSTECS